MTLYKLSSLKYCNSKELQNHKRNVHKDVSDKIIIFKETTGNQKSRMVTNQNGISVPITLVKTRLLSNQHGNKNYECVPMYSNDPEFSLITRGRHHLILSNHMHSSCVMGKLVSKISQILKHRNIHSNVGSKYKVKDLMKLVQLPLLPLDVSAVAACIDDHLGEDCGVSEDGLIIYQRSFQQSLIRLIRFNIHHKTSMKHCKNLIVLCGLFIKESVNIDISRGDIDMTQFHFVSKGAESDGSHLFEDGVVCTTPILPIASRSTSREPIIIGKNRIGA